MDYGQPMNCNCGSRSCSSYTPEPEKKIEEVLPQWLRDMLDTPELTFQPQQLQPVGSDQYTRSNPTSLGGDTLYPFNANARVFGNINGLAGMLASPHFKDIATNNLCKEINVPQPITRMEVTQENFFEMHELAKNNGYKGDAEEFRQALNAGEPIQLDVETLKPAESAFDAARAVPGAPANLDVKAFLNAMCRLTSGPAEARGLGVAKLQHLPEVVLKTGDPATLTEYVSKTMIPTFVKEITELGEKFEGIELLRQQRRLQERLNKLMMYSTKPERIVGKAIHDDHELAIYKCYIAQRVIAGSLQVMAGQNLINEARNGLHERKAAVAANQAKQKKEQERKELLTELQGNLFLLAEDVTKMEVRTAASYLRKMADGLGIDPEPVKPVTEKDLIVKGVDSVQAEEVKKSPLLNMSEAERRGVVDSFRSAFADALGGGNGVRQLIPGMDRPLTEAEKALFRRLSTGYANIPDLWKGNSF